MKVDPWLLVPEGVLIAGREIALDQQEARHASGALRSKCGDRVVLTDGEGSIAGAELTRCVRSDAVAVIDEVITTVPPRPGPTVALGILHTKAMDWAIQKAVEVGVLSFLPLLCDRSQGSYDRACERLEHWRRVSLQALKQCRRAWKMQIHNPVTIVEVVGGRLKPGYVADQESVVGGCGVSPDLSTLVVGPEGGLTAKELAALKGAGWSTVALGPHVLRAETAAIVGAALLTLKLNADSR